ncbi:MAG: AMP-binding protein [Bdellovibrionota bacterium]
MKIKGLSFLDESGLHHEAETFSLITKTAEDIGKLPPGIVVIEADRSLRTVIRFLSSLHRGDIVFMLPPQEFRNTDFLEYFRQSAGPLHLWAMDEKSPVISHEGNLSPKLQGMKNVFLVKTSGTSGMKNKFVLHSTELFLQKFSKRVPDFERTINFFPPDSIAGIETLLECMVHGKTLVNPWKEVEPSAVTNLLEKEKIDYLHVTPTFLNLMLLSGGLNSPHLKSVKMISFGSEPAQKNILEKIKTLSPQTSFRQIYGMSEIGLLKTVSHTDDPAWFQLDEKVNPWRVKDGFLEVKSESPMITYLNHDKEVVGGWFATGDAVQENGSLLKVVGRSDDVINVAGKKFHPIELEELLMEMDGMDDVMVTSEPNELIGNSVHVKVSSRMDEREFRMKLKVFLEEKVPAWMRPQRVIFDKSTDLSVRLKKRRKTSV